MEHIPKPPPPPPAGETESAPGYQVAPQNAPHDYDITLIDGQEQSHLVLVDEAKFQALYHSLSHAAQPEPTYGSPEEYIRHLKLVQPGTGSSQKDPDSVLISISASVPGLAGFKHQTQLSVSRQDLLQLARLLEFDAAKQAWFESIRHIRIEDSPVQRVQWATPATWTYRT
jgi:hypothetical protein